MGALTKERAILFDAAGDNDDKTDQEKLDAAYNIFEPAGEIVADLIQNYGLAIRS